MKQIPVFPGASDAPSKFDRRVSQGIAHILGRQGEVSQFLREAADGAGEGLADGIGAIPHIDLFYNLEEIFSQMSHEGRNYMSPILGYASLISENAPHSSPEHKWAGKLVSSIRSMERYFVQLDIYRMKGISQVSKTDWSRFLDNVLESFLKIHKNQTSIDIVNNLHGSVTVHTELLRRVLVHILRNASESMEKNGTIRIEACLEEARSPGSDGGDCIAVTVTDEGCGIAESKYDYIWKPFFTTKPNRFGLGLSYVSMAASILDMSVDLHSELGKGTTFSLKLKTKGEHIDTPKTLSR